MPEVLEYVATLPPGSHAVFCYDNEPEATVIFQSYLQGGLDRNETTRLLTPNREEYERFLRNTGIDVKSLEKDGSLGYVLISDAVLDKGRLSSSKRNETAMKFAQQNRELGFRGTRVIGLCTHYLEYDSPSDVLRYERERGGRRISISGICCYNAHWLIESGYHEFLLGLYEVHSQIIGKGLAWQK